MREGEEPRRPVLGRSTSVVITEPGTYRLVLKPGTATESGGVSINKVEEGEMDKNDEYLADPTTGHGGAGGMGGFPVGVYGGDGGAGGGGVTSGRGDDGEDRFVLDPSDPFERACMDIVRMNRRKRADYSADGSIWWNFDATAAIVGCTRAEVIFTNIAQKVNRLRSLWHRDKIVNESVIDTKLDLAVYSILLYTESQS